MWVIGITGPVASGKSTLASLLAAKGFPLLDADKEAHALYVPGSELMRQIEGAFGSRVVTDDGELDRSALGKIVFSDASALEKLERIVHPPLRAAIEYRLNKFRDAGEPLVLLEAALLMEWEGLADRIIGVVAPRSERKRRLTAKGWSETDAEARLDKQLAEERLSSEAWILVHNTGALEDLEYEAETIRRRLLTLVRRPSRKEES